MSGKDSASFCLLGSRTRRAAQVAERRGTPRRLIPVDCLPVRGLSVLREVDTGRLDPTDEVHADHVE
jgi:hypothetical protein